MISTATPLWLRGLLEETSTGAAVQRESCTMQRVRLGVQKLRDCPADLVDGGQPAQRCLGSVFIQDRFDVDAARLGCRVSEPTKAIGLQHTRSDQVHGHPA